MDRTGGEPPGWREDGPRDPASGRDAPRQQEGTGAPASRPPPASGDGAPPREEARGTSAEAVEGPLAKVRGSAGGTPASGAGGARDPADRREAGPSASERGDAVPGGDAAGGRGRPLTARPRAAPSVRPVPVAPRAGNDPAEIERQREGIPPRGNTTARARPAGAARGFGAGWDRAEAEAGRAVDGAWRARAARNEDGANRLDRRFRGEGDEDPLRERPAMGPRAAQTGGEGPERPDGGTAPRGRTGPGARPPEGAGDDAADGERARAAEPGWRGRPGFGGERGEDTAGGTAEEVDEPLRRRPRRLPLVGAEEPGVSTVPREERFTRRRELRRVVRTRRSVLPSRPAAEGLAEDPSFEGDPALVDPHPGAGPAAGLPEAAAVGTAALPAAVAPPGEPPAAGTDGSAEARDRAAPAGELAAAAEVAERIARTAPEPPPSPGPGARPRTAPRQRPLRGDAAGEPALEEGPIVSPDTVSARGLAVVVAIMTFLSALLTGGAVLVDRAAGAWSAEVLDEISVSVLPRDGDPVGRRLEEVAEILRTTPGLGDVRIVPQEESEALLEPWLGTDLDLSLLPVPRLVTAARTGPVDVEALDLRLAGISGASLDDHAGWSERLADMAAAVAGGAIAALLLMLCATALAIVFATRATIAANAGTVEVLTILGAEERFIVHVFRRRFVATGLRGVAAGLALAALLFGILDLWAAISPGSASPQARALFGDPSIGPFGYLALAGVGLAVAALVAITSTLAVRRHLDHLTP